MKRAMIGLAVALDPDAGVRAARGAAFAADRSKSLGLRSLRGGAAAVRSTPLAVTRQPTHERRSPGPDESDP